MAGHAEITLKTWVAIYFYDPDSLWQRCKLDAIAYELSIRPRKRFGFMWPIEDMTS